MEIPQQRLGVDFTYYQTDTKNQLLRMPNSAGEQYVFLNLNAGKTVVDKGFEITVDATPVMTNDFRWKTAVNYSQNKNKIISLHPRHNSFVYGDPDISMAYIMEIKEGGFSWGRHLRQCICSR